MIHLGVHKHLVVDEKCKEFVNETRRLVIEEVNRTLDANISAILLNISKNFLTMHTCYESGNGLMELSKGE
jgi:hypothetical protein